MTIVMEEDGFSSLSSLSCLSPQQSNSYQTLTSSSSSLQSNGIHNTSQQQQQQAASNSSNSPNSLSDYNGPYALFLFRSSSSLELFEERRISLDKPCKIGRSVAKIKPEPNNAIFDCKVLSRNHALLWHENSKFFIQDTKSSNGTFLNGNRLGKSNEDSAPFELTSGDIIQFGVDVTENTKKVTHGCITVELKLFFKPGVEATNKSAQSSQSNKIDVQTQEIYQLALFLQEAMMREEILNQKLATLQKFIDQAKETSEANWLTLIDEDRLLSRIDFLEKQSLLHTKPFGEDSLKKCVNTLNNEKFSIETSAKQTIEKMIEEKSTNAQRVDELLTSLQHKSDECGQLQRMVDESKQNIIDLASKYEELLNELDELKQSSNEAKSKLLEKLSQAETDKSKYEQLYEESIEKEKVLNAKIESLIADNDFTSKRLEGILSKLEKEKALNNTNNKNNSKSIEDLSSASSSNHLMGNGMENGNGGDHHETEECNGFHQHTNQLDADSFKEEFNHQNVVVVKEEPSVGSNVSFTKMEINYTVENIIKNIESQPRVPEQKDAIIVNGISSDKQDLKDDYELLNRQLENQTKINSQLTNEIEKLKNLLSVSNDSIKSSTSNLNVSQQTEETHETNQVANGDVGDTNSLEDIIQLIKEQFDLIKNNKNNLEKETNFSKIPTTSKQSENEKLLDLFKHIDESFKRVNDANYSKQTESDLNSSENRNEPDNNSSRTKCQTLEESLKELEEDYEKRLNISEQKLEQINIEYDNLSLQTKIVSYCSTIPLLILIFAVMVAFYPTLSAITATGL